jgi:transcriptional regulator with XRE-family HTH domain
MTATHITPPTKSQIKEFLSCLTKLQKSMKLTKAQLADYVNVNRSTLTRWMTKKSVPSSEMMNLKYSFLDAYSESLYDEADTVKSALPESWLSLYHNRFDDL